MLIFLEGLKIYQKVYDTPKKSMRKCHIKAQQEKTTKCRNTLKFQLPTASKAGKKRHQKTPLARFGKDEVTSSTLVSSSTRNPLEFQGVSALVGVVDIVKSYAHLQKNDEKNDDATFFIQTYHYDKSRQVSVLGLRLSLSSCSRRRGTFTKIFFPDIIYGIVPLSVPVLMK